MSIAYALGYPEDQAESAGNRLSEALASQVSSTWLLKWAWRVSSTRGLVRCAAPWRYPGPARRPAAAAEPPAGAQRTGPM